MGAGVLVSLLRGRGLTNAIASGVAFGLMNGGITKNDSEEVIGEIGLNERLNQELGGEKEAEMGLDKDECNVCKSVCDNNKANRGGNEETVGTIDVSKQNVSDKDDGDKQTNTVSVCSADCNNPEDKMFIDQGSDSSNVNTKKSFADVVNKGMESLENKLNHVPTTVSENGMGRLGYARIFVEISAQKELVDYIDVLYKSKNEDKQFVKKVKVEYDWRPPLCTTCKVFGHNSGKCHTEDEEEKRVEQGKKIANEGFKNVENKSSSENMNNGKSQQYNKGQYADKRKEFPKTMYRRKSPQTANETQQQKEQSTNKPTGKAWNVGAKVVNEVRNTANTYSVLQEVDEENNSGKLSQKEKEEMYGKNKQRAENVEEIELDENDVYVDKSGTASFMTENEVQGVGSSNLTNVEKEDMGKYDTRFFGDGVALLYVG
ncbi:zinc knuckle CX2CX4HX4C [Artemisia annua]|uniref:Zinc knuckle CX2CX4HX4C n=1 Tax=Artemisia annua TaxID=35608 RepID=A0A2U1L7S2_ARTAN|nr:zinc knuckle CX2CX4HX4C [Artemisia annua]